MEAWRVCRLVMVDSHRLDEEQNPDPEKLDLELDVGWAITSVEVKTDKVTQIGI